MGAEEAEERARPLLGSRIRWTAVASRNATAVEVFSGSRKYALDFSLLQKFTETGAVHSSGEFRPWETASGPPGAGASAQPFPHNPRKQRKNPAAAGWGERFREGKWRMGWDSNPRWGLPHAGFQDQSLKPLGHPSGPGVIGGPPGGFKRGAFRRFGVQARGRPECKRCHALDAWGAHRCGGWPRSSPQGAAPCPGPRAGEGRPIVAGPFHRALWAICLPATCDPLAGTPRRPADGGLPGSRARPVHRESARHQGRQVRDDPDKMTLTGKIVAHRTARAGRRGRDDPGEKTRSVRRGQDDPLGMTSAGRHGQRQDDPGTMKRTG